jgi:hypothetical protein
MGSIFAHAANQNTSNHPGFCNGIEMKPLIKTLILPNINKLASQSIRRKLIGDFKKEFFLTENVSSDNDFQVFRVNQPA